MLNAYIIAPKDLTIRTDNTSVLSPLSFSACHINQATGLPVGVVSVRGKMYVGSMEELPVFVRYSDGRADILREADTQAITESEFVVSGTAILMQNHEATQTSTIPQIRPRDNIRRIVLGLLDDGNVFVIFCTATTSKLKSMLCAYGVNTALLLASDTVYFENPRSGIAYGSRPVATLHATYYEELPTPIVVIDPAHGGNDLGNSFQGLNEKDLTLTISKEIQSYLKDSYYGTFILTRLSDIPMSQTHRIQFINDLQADLVYTCHVNAYNGITRGVECFYDANSSDSVQSLVKDIHANMTQQLSTYGIRDNGLHPKQLQLFEMYPCPTFIAKTLYIDNAEDAHLLESKVMLRILAQAQGEAIAKALGLSKRVSNPQMKPTASEEVFKVTVGKFKFKLGAVELCDKLRQCGFDAYITKE